MAADVYSLMESLSLAGARAIIEGALAEGRGQSMQPLTIVVLDAGGHIVSMDREDGSGILRVEVARGKAYAALGIGISSGTIGQRNQSRHHFLAAVASVSQGQFVPVPGGVLVLDGSDRIIGAVGVSGDSSDNDEAAALAGIKAAGMRAGLDAAGG
ncbi:MAG: heme-binding protein [Ectothiorhodospiraceae bacterium]|nr:heme-binding protein [Ectothiorhodospiraceae bacterium]MCH8502721.1 heme-binding protein [Ectothiorhodospiraceae bacterium]